MDEQRGRATRAGESDDASDDGADAGSPAERLRARAAATDRAARFGRRLDEVERARTRRRRVRVVVRIAWAAVLAMVGALLPVAVAAATGAADPSGATLLIGATIGGAVGAVGPTLRELVARRRGARAWDAYHERHVLFGEPAARVHDADRPRTTHGGPPAPPDRR